MTEGALNPATPQGGPWLLPPLPHSRSRQPAQWEWRVTATMGAPHPSSGTLPAAVAGPSLLLLLHGRSRRRVHGTALGAPLASAPLVTVAVAAPALAVVAAVLGAPQGRGATVAPLVLLPRAALVVVVAVLGAPARRAAGAGGARWEELGRGGRTAARAWCSPPQVRLARAPLISAGRRAKAGAAGARRAEPAVPPTQPLLVTLPLTVPRPRVLLHPASSWRACWAC